MFYRIIHFIDSWFVLAVLGLYIAAFLLAASMMFIFPQITLLLFFLGLAGLGIAVTIGKTLGALSRSMGRHALIAGLCPMCRKPGARLMPEAETWHCEHCDAEFLRSGTEVVKQSPLSSDAA